MPELPPQPAHPALTTLLLRMRRGEGTASSELFAILYAELRDLANMILRPQRDGQTLQPTALVHEAYVRLLGDSALEIDNRAHFFGCAARAMREVLIDRARARQAIKRGGDRERVTLVDAEVADRQVEVDLVALDESLSRLEKLNERHCRVIELRFFAGLDVDQTASVLGVSARTVERDWRMARAWLLEEMGE